VLHLTAQTKATSWAGISPYRLRSLLAALPSTFDLTSLTGLHLSGTALQDGLLDEIAEKLPDVTVGTSYGMTETNGSISALSGAELRSMPSSSGRLSPSVECRIRDEHGNDLPCEEIGEIWLRGAMLMRDYCNTPRAKQDGWFNTGDMGQLSKERHLHVHGRDAKADGLSCSALERRAMAQDGIADAAAVRLPGADDVFYLAVSRKSGAQIDLPTLHARCMPSSTFDHAELRLAAMDELPRTRTGKVDRRRLVEILAVAP
jgi:acyl-CoA synthetase (AMP-forming)/AMP-acid ligase II